MEQTAQGGQWIRQKKYLKWNIEDRNIGVCGLLFSKVCNMETMHSNKNDRKQKFPQILFQLFKHKAVRKVSYDQCWYFKVFESIKWILHPKMIILSFVTYPYVVQIL